jgi:drug/metabolite transporter superfamily protein YnfA
MIFGASLDKQPVTNVGIFLYMFLVMPIFGTYFFWSWYWGYRALARVQPRIFLVLPLIGWLIYFMIKFSLGGVYGVCGGGIYEYLRSRRLVAAVHEDRILSEPQAERAKAHSSAA